MSDQRRTELNDNGTDPHMIQAPAPVVTAPFGPLVGSSTHRGIDMKTAPLTPETRFSYIPSIDDDLFAVRAGIPLATAADEAGCIVDAAVETVRRVACMISAEDGAHLLWSAVYSLTMAHGLLGSIQSALEDLEPSEAKAEPAPAPAPEAKADPEAMRQVWIDMAKMAADELAKLDRTGSTTEGAK